MSEDDASPDQDQEGQEGQQPETPDWIPVLINEMDQVREFVTAYLEQKGAHKERRYRHREIIVMVAAATLLLLIGGSAYMTIQGSLSGDAFTFVLGTLFGALLTFLQNMLNSETPDGS